MKNISTICIYILCVFLLVGCNQANGTNGETNQTEDPLTSAIPPSVDNPENNPEDDPADSPKINPEDSFEDNPIIGYWANFFQDSDGITHLNGFYFAEDGTGLIFHSSEGSLPITSYIISGDNLSIHFINTEDELAELSYRTITIFKNEIVITFDINSSDSSGKSYKRMQKIEGVNCSGGYNVTQLDGTTLEIQGFY